MSSEALLSPSPLRDPQNAEFRFESDAALDRGVALLAEQDWVEDCWVDRPCRSVLVRFGSGAPRTSRATRSLAPVSALAS